jgi:hypothetical protein
VTTVRLTFTGEQIGPKFDSQGKVIVQAALEAAQDVAEEGLAAGQEAITSARGNFGPRWPRGLRSRVTQSGGTISINFTHDIPYFWVHQEGAQINARAGGLMWIPLPGVNPNQQFANTFFQTSRKGNPILFQKVGKSIRPLRVGKESVFIPKRFRVKEEIVQVMQQFPEFWKKRYDELQNG